MGDSNNPFTYSDKGSNVGNGVLSLSYSCNGEKVKVESSQEPILLWIERKLCTSKTTGCPYSLATSEKKITVIILDLFVFSIHMGSL